MEDMDPKLAPCMEYAFASLVFKPTIPILGIQFLSSHHSMNADICHAEAQLPTRRGCSAEGSKLWQSREKDCGNCFIQSLGLS